MISHSFWDQKSRSGSRWLVLAQGLLRICNQVVDWNCRLYKDLTDAEESLPGSLTCCWLWVLVPHQVCLSIQNLASPGQVVSNQGLLWPNLVWGASNCHILLDTCQSWQRWEITEAMWRLTFLKHLQHTSCFPCACISWNFPCITSLNAFNILPSRCNWGIEMLSNFPKLFLSNRPWIKT